MVVHPHFQLFLYVFTLVAAVCLGLLFVKQKGVAHVADFDRILRESTKVADFEQILANQNYVDQKCKEAAAVAVEACAADTEGQTCYICFEGGSDEGLVRMCACRGGNGFVHVLCLAEQAKILFAHLLANGALLALCRRWIGKCKWARPQNECTQLVTRTIETPILSLRAGRDFFGVTNTCTTRGAQLAFGKTPLRRPQTLRGRAKTQPPGAGCPRDVRDELRSKSGLSATEY